MLREQRFALAEDLAAARIASGDGLSAIAGLPGKGEADGSAV
ncbi:hypothetical protein ACWD8I_21665 [Micromonospora arida]